MKGYEIFTKEKILYLYKATKPIKYKKLQDRIYFELSNHIDDMFCDYIDAGMSEEDATQKFLNEIGSPEELGEELKKANRVKLFWARIFKVLCIPLAIPILYLALVILINVGTEFENYFYADTAEEAEEWILENRTDGQPIKLLTEIEHDGVVHRIYVPQVQNKEDFQIYHIYSIEFFGFNIKNRFNRSHCHCEPGDNHTMASLDQQPIRDELMIYYNTPDYQYMKVQFKPVDDGLEEYWSDFIEIPQNATIDEPKYFILDCPDGYRWNHYERFDENKDIYIPEPSTNVTDCDSNRIKVHSSTVIH